MSAIRYSGALRIRVTYREMVRGKWVGDYQCTIVAIGHHDFVNESRRGEVKATIVVGPKTFETHARDSSEAFDEIARAALSFAEHEGWPVGYYAWQEPFGTGWCISRKSSL